MAIVKEKGRRTPFPNIQKSFIIFVAQKNNRRRPVYEYYCKRNADNFQGVRTENL